ncbi:protein FAR1-RELATED SEQUENCE 9-like isoform X3 [Punica granatum]|uniref:Protein FAR1-RELATED SEQUENCE n=1 Tax=Punica granatum TaxID=22663 RepID=A0A6P8DGS8_PUNGR|nr:protein FAR1-RELATED SEQUENCE 9-like isoform X3 [Punica granatum]
MASKVMSLTEFVNHYEKQLENMRDVEVCDDFECARGKQKLVVRDNGLLKHASDEYTHVIFKKFQDEFLQSMSVFIVSSDIGGPMHSYTLANESKMEHVVNFNSIDCTLTCSCKLFESLGWLCRHALHILNFAKKCPSIPSQYILERWTKFAKERISIDIDGSCPKNVSKSSKTMRLNRLMRHAFAVMSLSVDDDDTEKLAQQSLNELEKELKNLKATKGQTKHNILANGDAKTTSFGRENEMRVLDPMQMRPKGVPNKRIKHSLEKRKKRKSKKEDLRQASDYSANHNNPLTPELPINATISMDLMRSRYLNQYNTTVMHGNSPLGMNFGSQVLDDSSRVHHLITIPDLNEDLSI